MRLFLCEKPSQGKDIARVLGASIRANGCLIGNGLTVTWCIGHLLEAAPPQAYGEQYQRWSMADLPILPTHWQVEVKPKLKAQFTVIRRLLREAHEVVIATDADREGEMIARELLERCAYHGPIQRLWLSALNEASIREALTTLKSGDDTLPLYHSALARSRADWLVGINLSRLFTLLGREAGYDGVLSVGRVQTPTLRLVVERDRAIASFEPLAYWDIVVELSWRGQRFNATWLPPPEAQNAPGRCLQPGIARQAVEALAKASSARVETLTTKTVREPSPLPFDLGTLQQVCSRQLGLGVQQTLDIAQALYETHKAITYPRTDCRYLPMSLWDERHSTVEALLASDPSLQEVLARADLDHHSRAWNDAKITAHHAIMPTTAPFRLARLTEVERQVYSLIRDYYLVQFLPVHQYQRRELQLACEGQTLSAVGKRIKDLGWRSLLNPAADVPEQEHAAQTLPDVEIDAACHLEHTELQEKHTQPPKRLTEGELIKAMKNVANAVTIPQLKQKLKDSVGIGTEATRAGIITGLIERGYLLKKNRALIASPTAHTLIEAVPPAIADPGTTALWEQALDEVAADRLSVDQFVARQSTWLVQIMARYMDQSLSLPNKPSPGCPRCQSPMRQRHGKNGAFWSCSYYPDCNGTRPI